MKEFIKVSDTNRTLAEPGEIYFMVKIDTFSENINQMQPVMVGIADAVSKYVEKNLADKIYKGIEAVVQKEVEKMVIKHLEKMALECVNKIDLQAVANIAAISAGKVLGARVT